MRSMNKPIETFPIRITQTVTFRDQSGTIVKQYQVGDIVQATHASERGYYVTSMGGIWFEEAEFVRENRCVA